MTNPDTDSDGADVTMDLRPDSDIGHVWAELNDPGDADRPDVIHAGSGAGINMDMWVDSLEHETETDAVKRLFRNTVDDLFVNPKAPSTGEVPDDLEPAPVTVTLSPKFELYLSEGVVDRVAEEWDDDRITLSIQFEIVD